MDVYDEQIHAMMRTILGPMEHCDQPMKPMTMETSQERGFMELTAFCQCRRVHDGFDHAKEATVTSPGCKAHVKFTIIEPPENAST